MSEYTKCEIEAKSRDEVVEALVLLGWTKEQIEVHESPVDLIAYNGAKRTDRETGQAIKGNLIIRRQHVGESSNDLGLRQQADGSWVLYESGFDVGALQGRLGFPLKVGFKQALGIAKTKKEAKKQGFRIKNMPDKIQFGKKIKLQLERWG